MTRTGEATDIRDVQVIKEDRTFLLTDRFGDVPEDNEAALGLYYRDTRFLSALELSVNGQKPLLLHSSTERNYSQLVELTLPYWIDAGNGRRHRENLSIQRARVVAGALYETVRIRNYGVERRSLRLDLAFAADFLDIFDVRGLFEHDRGEMQSPRTADDAVVLAYRGLDGQDRSTTLRFSPKPHRLTSSEAIFEVESVPGEDIEISIEVVPRVGDLVPPATSRRDAEEDLARSYTSWRKRCTRFKTSNVQLSGFLERAILDLRMLMGRDDEGGRYFDAGVPWYSALFGRDALITAYEALAFSPDLAWQTLRGLAARQGKDEDEWTEEEPGKMLHELRVGELAGAGEIPHTPYYGSIDATPLWLVTLHGAYRWTGDLDAVRELWPNALAALRWIDEFGDIDGDGYVEYRRRSSLGLLHQGWKDSDDGICFPDGSDVEPPVALVEVQGTCTRPRSTPHTSPTTWATRSWRSASSRRPRISSRGSTATSGCLGRGTSPWPSTGTSARSRPSRPTRATVCGRGSSTRRRLPRWCTGWWGPASPLDGGSAPWRHASPPTIPSGTTPARSGRTTTRSSPTGCVGTDSTARHARCSTSWPPRGRSSRWTGSRSCSAASPPRTSPSPCSIPWPAGRRPGPLGPLLMVRSYGGLSADAPGGRLYIDRPRLPEWLERVEISGMRIGDARLDLVFTNRGGVTATEVPRKEGEIEVLIRQ